MTTTLLALLGNVVKSPLALAAALGLVAGLFLGHAIWKPPAPIAEVYAPPVRQADGSLILERTPDATARPTAIIPKGATVERIVDLTLTPKVPASHHEGAPPPAPVASPSPDRAAVPHDSSVGLQPARCPALHVELVLLRFKDGSRRVVAKSADAELGGVDIPVESASAPVRVPVWTVGPLFTFDVKHWGGYIGRTIGPVQLLVARMPVVAAGEPPWRAGVGIRF